MGVFMDPFWQSCGEKQSLLFTQTVKTNHSVPELHLYSTWKNMNEKHRGLMESYLFLLTIWSVDTNGLHFINSSID